ncbi:LacI family DNA-binding transcriptional regulator [Prauserella muralis]|uniref:LacI family transcriptional regulator n=1 Tax=Prauserella muralis TaxID=588067 RepID=A0A2V4AL94_9PSEU|nr:LacI family DNA-binding transcriptional regulator [Prauserella muralis]PXY20734.1 LacI family transcriptional regulator [Prauserella muralis]TWE29741.1 LacI family transcriptional regulator [Prauserella muralis]
MTDVARLARVSIKTVSRVVNGEPGVHPDTAARVHEAIDRLGFRRHAGASTLRRGTATGTLGLVVEDVGNPFYSELNRAVERVAAAHGSQVLTGSSDSTPDRERELALEFCARRVDGLLVVPSGERHSYLAAEQRAGTPVVFVDRPGGELAADAVLVDNAGGTAEAVAHLAARGHRRIAFLGDDAGLFTARERLRGFREGCAKAGVPYDERLVRLHRPTERGVGEAARAVLDGPGAATAVVTGNNRVTVHLLRALATRARRPALVGFDDFELADLLDPPVSVIAHDVAALGRTAAELLFARAHGDTSPPRKVVLPVRLVPRGSGEVPA